MASLENATERRGLRARVGVHNTARLDAIMLGVNGDCDILGLQQGLQRYQHLLGESFLHLRTLREETHDTVNLGQTNNLILRYICHLGGAVDSYEMMFAGTGQADIADFDHFFDTHLACR